MRRRKAHTTVELLIDLPLITSLLLVKCQRLSQESTLVKYDYFSLSEGVVFVRLFTNRGVP